MIVLKNADGDGCLVCVSPFFGKSQAWVFYCSFPLLPHHHVSSTKQCLGEQTCFTLTVCETNGRQFGFISEAFSLYTIMIEKLRHFLK